MIITLRLSDGTNMDITVPVDVEDVEEVLFDGEAMTTELEFEEPEKLH